MNRLWIFMLVVVCPILVLAETAPPGTPATSSTSQPYQPAVPAPSINTYGGWPGYGGGGTAAGSAMNGMASVISAKGDYNLSTSAAAINMTQAQKNEIENRQQATNAYFDMRATNRAARAAEAGPKPTMEQIARMAHDGVPKQISPSQLNPVTGKIEWPIALQADRYADQRTTLEQLVAKQATYGSLGLADHTKVRQTVDAMFAELKSQVKDVPPQDYVASRSFLRSLDYLTTKSDL
jgi:hypothetical protein